MAQKDPIFRAVCEISDERAIDLHDVDRQSLEVPQRCVAGAKIVEGDAAARMAQRIDKPRSFLDVVECRRFGDFDDETARKFGPVPQQGHQ